MTKKKDKAATKIDIMSIFKEEIDKFKTQLSQLTQINESRFFQLVNDRNFETRRADDNFAHLKRAVSDNQNLLKEGKEIFEKLNRAREILHTKHCTENQHHQFCLDATWNPPGGVQPVPMPVNVPRGTTKTDEANVPRGTQVTKSEKAPATKATG